MDIDGCDKYIWDRCGFRKNEERREDKGWFTYCNIIRGSHKQVNKVSIVNMLRDMLWVHTMASKTLLDQEQA
tara:strand:+ start:341 stop:556 length:216 start_codon:yes stop_codon:yes gene_type:complete